MPRMRVIRRDVLASIGIERGRCSNTATVEQTPELYETRLERGSVIHGAGRPQTLCSSGCTRPYSIEHIRRINRFAPLSHVTNRRQHYESADMVCPQIHYHANFTAEHERLLSGVRDVFERLIEIELLPRRIEVVQIPHVLIREQTAIAGRYHLRQRLLIQPNVNNRLLTLHKCERERVCKPFDSRTVYCAHRATDVLCRGSIRSD